MEGTESWGSVACVTGPQQPCRAKAGGAGQKASYPDPQPPHDMHRMMTTALRESHLLKVTCCSVVEPRLHYPGMSQDFLGPGHAPGVGGLELARAPIP